MTPPPHLYHEPPDVPEGMTLGEYRRHRARPLPVRRRGRVRRALDRAAERRRARRVSR